MKFCLPAVYLCLLCVYSVCEGLETECMKISMGSRRNRYSQITIGRARKITNMRVEHMYSKSKCEHTNSYGFLGVDAWVHRGCRAQFHICYEPGESNTVECRSDHYNYVECTTWVRYVLEVYPISQHSSSPCIRDFSYGKKGDQLWVDKGCKATFRITGKGD